MISKEIEDSLNTVSPKDKACQKGSVIWLEKVDFLMVSAGKLLKCEYKCPHRPWTTEVCNFRMHVLYIQKAFIVFQIFILFNELLIIFNKILITFQETFYIVLCLNLATTANQIQILPPIQSGILFLEVQIKPLKYVKIIQYCHYAL